MNGARLFVGALIRLSILAAILWLTLADCPWMAVALIALFLLTPLDAKPAAKPATPATPPKP